MPRSRGKPSSPPAQQKSAGGTASKSAVPAPAQQSGWGSWKEWANSFYGFISGFPALRSLLPAATNATLERHHVRRLAETIYEKSAVGHLERRGDVPPKQDVLDAIDGAPSPLPEKAPAEIQKATTALTKDVAEIQIAITELTGPGSAASPLSNPLVQGLKDRVRQIRAHLDQAAGLDGSTWTLWMHTASEFHEKWREESASGTSLADVRDQIRQAALAAASSSQGQYKQVVVTNSAQGQRHDHCKDICNLIQQNSAQHSNDGTGFEIRTGYKTHPAAAWLQGRFGAAANAWQQTEQAKYVGLMGVSIYVSYTPDRRAGSEERVILFIAERVFQSGTKDLHVHAHEIGIEDHTNRNWTRL